MEIRLYGNMTGQTIKGSFTDYLNKRWSLKILQETEGKYIDKG